MGREIKQQHNKKNCRTIHTCDGIQLDTIDDKVVMNIILNNYVEAFFHVKEHATKLAAIAKKRGVTGPFVAVCQLLPNQTVNTRKIPWAIFTRANESTGHLPWDQLKRKRDCIMLHVKLYYGNDEEEPSSVEKTFFANI